MRLALRAQIENVPGVAVAKDRLTVVESTPRYIVPQHLHREPPALFASMTYGTLHARQEAVRFTVCV